MKPILQRLCVALFMTLSTMATTTTAFVVTTTMNHARSIVATDLQMTVLTYNGKKKDFKAGSPMSKAAASLGVPVKYSCKKGDCATCQILLAGRYVRCCTGKVPEEPRLKSLQEKGLEIRV